MFLAGLALKSTAVLASACLITLFLRGRSAAVRHLVWTAASAAVLMLPLLSVSLPALRVPLPAGATGPAAFQVFASARVPQGPHSTQTALPVRKAGAAAPVDWMPILVGLWAAGTLLAFGRMLAAWVTLARLRRRAKPFCDGGFRGVDVLETPSGSMPMAFGILRSAILLPADAAEWSEERRQVVLLHELAHVRRGDVATHLLARIALIAYWWNPLAWFAWREFVKERERAADDLVLNAGTSAPEYARHLLEVARSMQLAPATGWAAVAMVRRSQLEIRLRSILDSRVNRKATGRASALIAAMAAMVAGLLVAPLAAVRAQEVKVGAVPADVEATIRSAISQNAYQVLEDDAKAAVEARQFDVAEKLLEAAVGIRGHISSREQGLGLLKLAELQQRRHESEVAEASYTKAAQLLGEDPKAAAALLHLGASALFKKNYSQATAYFQHAQQVDPASAGMALMWSAVVMETQKNNGEADALFRRAVAQQDPKTAEAATIVRVYGNFLRAQGRGEEADALESRLAFIPAAHAEPPAGVYRIGGAIHAPKLLEKVEPEYSEEAREAKLTGTEVLFVQVGIDGVAHAIQVVRGLGLGLDEAGVDAISQWRFKPGEKDGQPVTVLATIEINFRLL
jgi:TonB family protein